MVTVQLPIVTIQPTFRTVISEVNSGIIPFDSFWVSCYKQPLPSVHTKIHAQLDETDRNVVNLEPEDSGVQVRHWDTTDSYTVACSSLDIPPTRILLPEQEYADPERANPQRPQRITAFDVSPDGTQFATGFHDGSVHIYAVSPTPEHSIPIKRTSKAHLSSITSLRFFPSSRVLLTAGADFTLTVLPADLPPQDATTASNVLPARTLRGHTRSITSTGIISRGRNILSGSKDGTVRLWDISSAKQLHSSIAGKGKYTPVLDMSLGELGEVGKPLHSIGDGSNGSGAAMVDESEVDTPKVVFCALSDGSFEVLDLRSKTSVFQSTVPTQSDDKSAALTSIVYSDSHQLVATGSINGLVTVFDSRSLSTPLTSFHRNTACVEDLSFCGLHMFSPLFPTEGPLEGRVGLIVTTEDGLPFIANVLPDGQSVQAELVGGDCDGVRAVRVSEEGVIWTAADDGIVRKYQIL